MSFTPKFMKHFAAFSRERQAIRSLKDWRDFKKRWFSEMKDLSQSLPRKSSKQLTEENLQKRKTISKIHDGRGWAPCTFTIDVTAKARYEYFWTCRTIGAPLEDPRWNPETRKTTSGWMQECGYCDIATFDLGSEVCPACGRALYYCWVSD